MNILKKKMTLAADLFPILWTSKNVVKQISKSSRFRGPFNKQHGKADQTLLKSEPHHLYHLYWLLCRQLSWKKYLLMICKVLAMFVNILTSDDKYFLLNRENLRQPIQMQLSHKQKHLLNLFLHFSKLN